MPGVEIVGRNVAENDALRRLEFFDLDLDFVEVRLAIGSGVDSHDFHDSPLIKKLRLSCEEPGTTALIGSPRSDS
jgi:hypothetical protein